MVSDAEEWREQERGAARGWSGRMGWGVKQDHSGICSLSLGPFSIPFGDRRMGDIRVVPSVMGGIRCGETDHTVGTARQNSPRRRSPRTTKGKKEGKSENGLETGQRSRGVCIIFLARANQNLDFNLQLPGKGIINPQCQPLPVRRRLNRTGTRCENSTVIPWSGLWLQCL